MLRYLALACSGTLAATSPTCSPGPSISTTLGTCYGNDSINGLNQLLGSRYAKPPVGSLRFAVPDPYPGDIKLVWDATEYGMGCTQGPAFGLFNGLREDCLTLNIVRPSDPKRRKEPLPVMFWTHGGGNVNGLSILSILYKSFAIVQHSLVLNHAAVYVGINYRLGAFSSLTSPEFNAAGLSSLGLEDQYLALQCLHENIGGDPSKVMIFGESACAVDCWAQSHYAAVKDETCRYMAQTRTKMQPSCQTSSTCPTGAPWSEQL